LYAYGAKFITLEAFKLNGGEEKFSNEKGYFIQGKDLTLSLNIFSLQSFTKTTFSLKQELKHCG
jgi:hypothetical protein